MDNFNAKYKYFDDIASSNGFKSIWSIFSVEDINGTCNSKFEGCKVMSYTNHWGEPVEVTLPEGSLTWLQLWQAADQCIERSGDHHHVFVEAFRRNGGVLELITGS